MKKTETAIVIITFIGFFFNVFGFPRAEYFIIIPITSLAFFYFHFSPVLFYNIKLDIKTIFFRKRYPELKGWKRITALALGWSLAISLLGIGFKLLLYPGADIMLNVGTVNLTILIVLSVFMLKRQESESYKKFLKRGVVVAVIAFSFVLTPIETLISWRYKDFPEYSKALIELRKEPRNQELILKEEQLRREMEQENGAWEAQ